MATELDRVRVILGERTPTSPSMAAWLATRKAADGLAIHLYTQPSALYPIEGPSFVAELGLTAMARPNLRAALAAAVVEVDRIEREAKQP